jgi:hypothetical protein
MGGSMRSTSATKSDASVKLGVPTSSRTSLPARIQIAVPPGRETFTIVVVVSSDTSLIACTPSSSRRPSHSRRITGTRWSMLGGLEAGQRRGATIPCKVSGGWPLEV